MKRVYRDYRFADIDKVYYLASPYSHENAFVRSFRYEAVIYAGALLTKQGYQLIEPMGMAHPPSLAYAMPTGYEFWKVRDRNLISRCDGTIVFTLPGWEISEGVQDEIKWTTEQHKPVFELPVHEVIPPELQLDLLPKL